MSGKEIMENSKWTENSTEASTGIVLQKKVFLEILKNWQENTCVRVSFFIKLQAPELDELKNQIRCTINRIEWYLSIRAIEKNNAETFELLKRMKRSFQT